MELLNSAWWVRKGTDYSVLLGKELSLGKCLGTFIPIEMKSVGENFLAQVIEEPTNKSALLDLLFTNKEGHYVEVEGSLAFSDHEAELKILSGGAR